MLSSDNKVDQEEHKSGETMKNSANKKIKVHKRKVAKKVAATTVKASPKTPPAVTLTKLPGRQTNNSLSSITAGHILIETTNTTPPSSTPSATSTPSTTVSKNVETTPTSSAASPPRKKKNKAAEV